MFKLGYSKFGVQFGCSHKTINVGYHGTKIDTAPFWQDMLMLTNSWSPAWNQAAQDCLRC